MLSASVLKMIGGVACLLFSVWAIRRIMPKEGKPRSAWISTELRSSVTAIALMVLVIAGVALLLQGALA